MEYSDANLEATSITMTVQNDQSLSGGPCTISSAHSRSYITQYGPYIPQAGAWWICKGGQPGSGSAWPTTSGLSEFKEQIVPRSWTVSGSSDVSVKAIDGVSTTSSTSTSSTSTTTTPTKSSASCGYIPDSCAVDLEWAVNSGSQSNPEYYPNFYDVTNVDLSATTADDMVYYWVCSGINPNGNCDNLQLPCSKPSCDDDATTKEPTPRPTEKIECGYIPNECVDDLAWAVSTGSQNLPQWYPNFYSITGVELSDTTADDMIYYWVCTETNPNGDCTGLQIPCSRSKCDNGLTTLSFVEDNEEVEDTSTNTPSMGTTTILAIVSIASVIIICGMVIFLYCCYRKKNNGKATFKDEKQDKEPEVEISVEMEVEDRETHSTETNEEI